jgi:hypothetical protein
MTQQTHIVSLNDCLTFASYVLGETTPPASQVAIRTNFANIAKHEVESERNWSFEYTEPSPINLVAGQTAYPLSLVDIKTKNSLDYVQVYDGSTNPQAQWPFYSPTTRRGILNALNNAGNSGGTLNLYSLVGNNTNGYTIYIAPSPIISYTGGIAFGYYAVEAPFVNLVDTTNIPHEDLIGWYIAAQVYLGYREQAQYQLAMNNFQDGLEQLANMDFKQPPNTDNKILNINNLRGFGTSFKTRYF